MIIKQAAREPMEKSSPSNSAEATMTPISTKRWVLQNIRATMLPMLVAEAKAMEEPTCRSVTRTRSTRDNLWFASNCAPDLKFPALW
jgi:hypothetical protein